MCTHLLTDWDMSLDIRVTQASLYFKLQLLYLCQNIKRWRSYVCIRLHKVSSFRQNKPCCISMSPPLFYLSPLLACPPSVIYQTDLLARQHIRPPLRLTPLTNRLPATASGLWPCHSLARLIGFHLSLQRKGSDYKQINRVGLHGQSASPDCLNPPVTGEEIESVWKW